KTREPSFFSVFRKPILDTQQVDRDVASLEAYYRSIGYPDATVRLDHIEYLEKHRFADIYITVVEGAPNLVQSVDFRGHLILKEDQLHKDLLLVPGEPYNASLLETDIYTIRARYFDQGYLAVTIADSVRIENRNVNIIYYVNPRKQLYVGDITIDGNSAVRTGVIQKEITVKKGDVCRYNKVLETERNLFETGLFSVVDVLPEHVDTLTNVVDIRVRVRERKESWIEAGFGVGNVLGSKVFAEWGTRNLAGTGRTVRLKATYAFDLFSGNEINPHKFHITSTYYRYDAIYGQRRLFGLKLPSALNGYVEWDNTVPNLEVKTLGAALLVSHQFGRLRDFGRESQVVGSFSVEDITRNEAGAPESRSRSNILGGSISRDTRDFVLNPTVGSYRVLSSQIAGGILGGENDFYTVESTAQHYYGVETRSVFAWRLRAGYANSYGRSGQVPVENRYFLGGANSVRGYEESGLGPRDAEGNPIGGAFMLLANVEIRYPLPLLWRWNFSGAFFLDSGNVWQDISHMRGRQFRLFSGIDETTVDDYRYGVGLGIRYNTPIGPIRLDWGFPTKPDPINEKNMVYLSLGQIF
ncbi:MAG TPA: outer membrane protein assembly factor BamA, partial [Candidatus Krumholzibacteria bacterium]|nr:outer membrane protein assembly factor BamA [Candidatus Krumholzibacteria bacterium]